MELYLFQLFHNERALDLLKGEVERRRKEVEDVSLAKEREEAEVRAKMKEQKRVAKDLHKLDSEIAAMVSQTLHNYLLKSFAILLWKLGFIICR